MRPKNLKTRIFIDSGDPGETAKIMDMLGFLDGQTTNPTLISRNPEAQRILTERGFSKNEIFYFYRKTVEEISRMIPKGSVSVEVYADKSTTAEEMLEQGREMFAWIPNAHIKFPATAEGLKAAERAVMEGMRINMTLCFTQEQAAAVYAATKGARKGNVFVSPFVGRLDDLGENGMNLAENIIRMYKEGDGHVEVLTASIRSTDHLLYALSIGSDIITAPFKVLKEWAEKGMPLPENSYNYRPELKEIPYKKTDLSRNWKEFVFSHTLLDKGIERFSNDWNSLIKNK
ncbi:MAG: transaldolase [Candidatus Aenigmarchaeota archaeon]|nr:transaldolase [Candidatus Aenigmarchaeota archaeon]